MLLMFATCLLHASAAAGFLPVLDTSSNPNCLWCHIAGHPADNSLYFEQLDNQSFLAKDISSTKGMQHLMTANMLYAQRKYSAALDELEQANALVPGHHTVLHLRGMCKAELNQYEDAIADLTGRAHYSNALYSRGMCHLNLGNHEKAFDDILRADILDSKIGETLCGAMKLVATIDPGNPQVQRTAQICVALEKRKLGFLKVRLLLYVFPCCPMLSHKQCNDTRN